MIKLVQSTPILIDLFPFFMLCNDQIDKRAYTGKPIITLPAIYLFVSFSFTFSTLHYYDHNIFFILCNDQIDKRAYICKPIITFPAIYLFVSFSFTFSSLHYYDHNIVSTRLCVSGYQFLWRCQTKYKKGSLEGMAIIFFFFMFRFQEYY